MKISVIVPTYNNEDTIEPCLKAIRLSRHAPFELIVVDDGSTDRTTFLAKRFADRILPHPHNIGRSHARLSGARQSQGEILLFIDSDIVVKPDTLTKVAGYFAAYPEVDAVTGQLAKEHPYDDYFSQYKNLYMNYIFGKLPERVNFLYGSIHAVRRRSLIDHDTDFEIADDTAMGQKLVQHGKNIGFLKELEVIHLKQYDFLSWIKNDFKIPFDWARIFLKYRGWKELGKNRSGYLHAPKEQLASVLLAPPILFLLLAACLRPGLFPWAGGLAVVWLLLNLHFLVFLARERGLRFGIFSVFATFIDHLVMAGGIICGWLSYRSQSR
jgi:glycosyltransferase involved in cell wall biosynthesis